ncbi:hypothetical protein D3C71_1737180 [compost metagenome]
MRVGVTVEGNIGQGLSQFAAQWLRQAVRVFHGVQLDKAGGIGNVVGLHGQHVGAEQLLYRHFIRHFITGGAGWNCRHSPTQSIHKTFILPVLTGGA